MTTHTVETISSCEKRISVIVDAEKVKEATSVKVHTKIRTAEQKLFQQKAEQLKKLKYGGFRPNKLVTQKYIASKITSEEKEDIRKQISEEDIRKQICNDNASSLLSEEKINYQGMPIIQDIQLNDDQSLSYTILIETYPEIPHVHWENVQIEKLDTHSTEENIAKALPLFKGMGFDPILESKEVATQWCEWMIEVFQHQKLRDQVIKELINQNKINELPKRIVEARYQELKKEDLLDDKVLYEKARQYIIADILFKAYALEHNITINRETLLERITKAAQNPFIMSHVKDESLLPYYLAPRIFEEKVIEHLVKNTDCTTQMIPFEDFMALALNLDTKEREIKEAKVLEESTVEARDLLESSNLTQAEENPK